MTAPHIVDSEDGVGIPGWRSDSIVDGRQRLPLHGIRRSSGPGMPRTRPDERRDLIGA